MDLSNIVLTSADYKILLITPLGKTYPLLTVDSFSMNRADEEEMIYVPKPGAQGELGYGNFEKNPNFRRRLE